MRALFLASGLCIALSACGERISAAPDPAAGVGAPAKTRLTLAELPAPYNQADLANGKAAFAKCEGCHALDPALGHKMGPNLHGVFDRPPGSAEAFRYSAALSAVSLERWTTEDLDRWLSDPTGYLPGSSMFFNGIDDAATRRDIIAHLLVESR